LLVTKLLLHHKRHSSLLYYDIRGNKTSFKD